MTSTFTKYRVFSLVSLVNFGCAISIDRVNMRRNAQEMSTVAHPTLEEMPKKGKARGLGMKWIGNRG